MCAHGHLVFLLCSVRCSSCSKSRRFFQRFTRVPSHDWRRGGPVNAQYDNLCPVMPSLVIHIHIICARCIGIRTWSALQYYVFIGQFVASMLPLVFTFWRFALLLIKDIEINIPVFFSVPFILLCTEVRYTKLFMSLARIFILLLHANYVNRIQLYPKISYFSRERVVRFLWILVK